jgi:hypothetical protein
LSFAKWHEKLRSKQREAASVSGLFRRLVVIREWQHQINPLLRKTLYPIYP